MGGWSIFRKNVCSAGSFAEERGRRRVNEQRRASTFRLCPIRTSVEESLRRARPRVVGLVGREARGSWELDVHSNTLTTTHGNSLSRLVFREGCQSVSIPRR